MSTYSFFKRTFDLLISASAVIILSPVLLLVVALIPACSGRPVFFVQERVGKDGKGFKILKFRTMAPDADLRGPKITSKSDPRVTGIGRYLRRWKIDEWPQLFNVIKNDMSLVGPRPEIPWIVKRYNKDQIEILTMKPGIFGPSQIAGRFEEEEYPDSIDAEKFYLEHILPLKIERDLRYVNERSLAKDLGYFIRGMEATIKGAV